MKGATGRASLFSLSDWWKYSSIKHSTQPSDTWNTTITYRFIHRGSTDHDRPTLVRDVTGLDQYHLESVQMILRAVVKVVKFLFKIIQYLCMSGHICGKYQNDHILKTKYKSFLHPILVPTPRMSLNSSSERLEKILHSGELRILKEIAQ